MEIYRDPPRGGKRPGAGRPSGTGMYGTETKPVRVPLAMIKWVKLLAYLYKLEKDVLTAARLLVAQLETNEKKNG